MGNLKHYILLMRPRQWIKNLFVFAVLFFSLGFFNLDKVVLNLLLFLSFCFIASSVYIMNDLKDIERDRNHPLKKFRPIASGKVKVKESIVLLALLVLISLVIAGALNKYVFLIIVVYFVMNIFYTFKFKNYVIIDCFIIAIGFILRLVSGSVLLSIEPSNWIIVCTFLLSLFLALNKRRSEMILTKNNKAETTRDNLKDYSLPLIDSMLNIVTSATFISYCIYTLNVSNSRYSIITILPVLYGIFRYKYLVLIRNEGGSVEETLLKDRSLLFSIGSWIVMNLILLYVI